MQGINRCEFPLESTSGKDYFRVCEDPTDFCPNPTCESPEVTANSCLAHMDTRNGQKMCEACCETYDQQTTHDDFVEWIWAVYRGVTSAYLENQREMAVIL
jgi:hypothetical protein